MGARWRKPAAGRITGAGSTCDHGRRAATCMRCHADLADDQAWDRAVDEDRHRVNLMGYERPCEETCYLDLLADLEPVRKKVRHA